MPQQKVAPYPSATQKILKMAKGYYGAKVLFRPANQQV